MVPPGFDTLDWLSPGALRRPLLRWSLTRIGLEWGDVLAVRMGDRCHYFELAGDCPPYTSSQRRGMELARRGPKSSLGQTHQYERSVTHE